MKFPRRTRSELRTLEGNDFWLHRRILPAHHRQYVGYKGYEDQRPTYIYRRLAVKLHSSLHGYRFALDIGSASAKTRSPDEGGARSLL